MTWHPATLHDAIGAKEVSDDEFDENGIARWKEERGRPRRYACACGAWRPAELIIDTRSLGLAQDFACDGCWTQWEREGVQVTAKREPGNRKEWKRDWCEALGAPTEVLQKIDARRDPEPYGGKVTTREGRLDEIIP